MERDMAVLYFQQRYFSNKTSDVKSGDYSKAEVDEFLDDVIKDFAKPTQLWSNPFVKRLLIWRKDHLIKPQVGQLNQTLYWK